MSLVIMPLKPVSGLAGVTNGFLRAETLVDVGPSGKLIYPASEGFKALQLAMVPHGMYLTYTYGGTYRTFAEQYNLFLSRYEVCSYSEYLVAKAFGRGKYWENAGAYGFGRYWRKKLVNGRYPATAAAPGTSNHGLGLAIDVAFDPNPVNGVSPAEARGITSHPAWPTFQKEVLKCGFSWELQSEPWHIRWVAGDVVPQYVRDVLKGGGGVTPVPPPPPPPTTNWMDAIVQNYPTLRVGASGFHVKMLQGALNAQDPGYAMTQDGSFGPLTEAKVKWFQGTKGLVADGIVGPKTWNAVLTQ